MEVDLIFRIAAIGIIVSVLYQVLLRSGREEQAMLTSLAGLIVVLTMLIYEISGLFDTVKGSIWAGGTMEITALIVLCIITALLALSLRGQRPEFAMLLSLGCGLFVLLYLLGQMKDIFSGLEDILSGLSGQSELTAIILKALGVCIVAELGSQCCRDAGETAIAAKVELAAKAALVMMSMPVFASLLEMAGELLRL